MHDILVTGETLVDMLPERPGALADVERFSRRAGGAPANVAVALARLERPPGFWTRIARDPFGEFLVDRLSAAGVPMTHVERDTRAQTGLAFVAHDSAADRSFTFYREETADTRLGVDGVPESLLDGVEWVVAGGLMLAREPGRSATFELVERAHDRGITVVFDPNARPEVWTAHDFAATVDRAFAHSDVVKATPEDLRAAGIDADDPVGLARAVADRGPHTVLLTMGEAGALAYATDRAPWGAGTVRHPGYEVDAVDTTGAGDAFTAGAVAGLADGEALAAVLSFANAVAAVATTETGAMTALPTRQAVTAFQGG